MPTSDSVVQEHSTVRASTDRREHDRAPLRSPVLVEAFSTWHRADSEDVSVGGVCVKCGEALPIGKVVEIYFELPSGVAVEARATVVRSSSGHSAFRFESLDHVAEVALRAHCHCAALKRA